MDNISKNFLHDLLDSSYKRNKEAEMIGNVHGLKLDHELSNGENKVFVDPDKNSHVVFTGTRKIPDLLTDASLLLGLEDYHPSFINSKKLIDKVKSKYNNKNIGYEYFRTSLFSIDLNSRQSEYQTHVLDLNTGHVCF